ncbi:MAG: MarC family protein [Duodenibacillus sp.]|nr:MarC family protein [Duodenibacillus sp.]
MEYTFLSAFSLLFLIVDPVGNIPAFVAILKKLPRGRVAPVVLRECAIGFVILTAFAFFGKGFMAMLGLSQVALTLGGALILLIIAIRMLFPGREGLYGEAPDGEPFVFPIAVPMLAGPSALATVMILLASMPEGVAPLLGAIGLTMALSALVAIFALEISRLAGPKITAAFERLMGLILLVIAVQMALTGTTAYIRSLAP